MTESYKQKHTYGKHFVYDCLAPTVVNVVTRGRGQFQLVLWQMINRELLCVEQRKDQSEKIRT